MKESVRFLCLWKGAKLRKGRETLSCPLSFTASHWGSGLEIVSNGGERKAFSLTEVHPKM